MVGADWHFHENLINGELNSWGERKISIIINNYWWLFQVASILNKVKKTGIHKLRSTPLHYKFSNNKQSFRLRMSGRTFLATTSR